MTSPKFQSISLIDLEEKINNLSFKLTKNKIPKERKQKTKKKQNETQPHLPNEPRFNYEQDQKIEPISNIPLPSSTEHSNTESEFESTQSEPLQSQKNICNKQKLSTSQIVFSESEATQTESSESTQTESTEETSISSDSSQTIQSDQSHQSLLTEDENSFISGSDYSQETNSEEEKIKKKRKESRKAQIKKFKKLKRELKKKKRRKKEKLKNRKRKRKRKKKQNYDNKKQIINKFDLMMQQKINDIVIKTLGDKVNTFGLPQHLLIDGYVFHYRHHKFNKQNQNINYYYCKSNPRKDQNCPCSLNINLSTMHLTRSKNFCHRKLCRESVIYKFNLYPQKIIDMIFQIVKKNTTKNIRLQEIQKEWIRLSKKNDIVPCPELKQLHKIIQKITQDYEIKKSSFDPEEITKTKNNKQFLWCYMKVPSIIVMWTSPILFNCLLMCKHIYIDGTFSLAPKTMAQFFIIQGYFPGWWGVLLNEIQRKSKKSENFDQWFSKIFKIFLISTISPINQEFKIIQEL
ncbi:hypothetical protein M0813_24869 [Anaeramoeba flamelloides]|uniref:Uncharacterized protein n=1 Tax=Anaeramoeba flamelloides TaxID=1746091 RepID=A0ABQ8Y4A2_9EUKA|nr:hypothetical protein M0813_24869 [Anaeramoeba flamelloides]